MKTVKIITIFIALTIVLFGCGEASSKNEQDVGVVHMTTENGKQDSLVKSETIDNTKEEELTEISDMDENEEKPNNEAAEEAFASYLTDLYNKANVRQYGFIAYGEANSEYLWEYDMYAIEDFDSDGQSELLLFEPSGLGEDRCENYYFYEYNSASKSVEYSNGVFDIPMTGDDYSYKRDYIGFRENGTGTAGNYIYFGVSPTFLEDIGFYPRKDENGTLHSCEGNNEVGYLELLYNGEYTEGTDSPLYYAAAVTEQTFEVTEHDFTFELSENDYKDIMKSFEGDWLEVDYKDFSSDNSLFANEGSSESAGYDEVLSDFKNAIQESSSESLQVKYGLENVEDIDYGYGNVLAYSIMDLDENGVDELIIQGSDTKCIVAMFTIDNGSVRKVFNGWSRSRYSILDDGRIYYKGSGGAAYSYSTYYNYEDGELIPLESGMTDENGYYYAEGTDSYELAEYNTISESEWLNHFFKDEIECMSIEYIPVVQ